VLLSSVRLRGRAGGARALSAQGRCGRAEQGPCRCRDGAGGRSKGLVGAGTAQAGGAGMGQGGVGTARRRSGKTPWEAGGGDYGTEGGGTADVAALRVRRAQAAPHVGAGF
jgi:hypothetical protein